MIPKECKRLAEVDFPIAEVSRHAVREKAVRHGHPSTLHLWWARRPLASSRAVLLGLLLPDPCHPLCPEGFKAKARELLPQVQGSPGPADADLRKALLKFIGDFADWDLAANRSYLDVSRALVKAAHGDEPPLVVDPFAGGGSIPLEALRLGCEAFASDLNPVACLILKVVLEDIPRQGPQLAEELRRVGAEIKRRAENELAALYPKDPDGATPIAYLWARSVRCEAPNCGVEIPLVRSFWLCKKASRYRALRHQVVRGPAGPPRVEFEVFEPGAEKDVPGATVTRAKARCVACGAVLAPERVRAQLTAQRGGADVVFDAKGHRVGGARILAVVTLRKGESGRHYRSPTERDYDALRKAAQWIERVSAEEPTGRMSSLPNEEAPATAGGFLAPPTYGMRTWGDMFSSRQKVALTVLARHVRESRASTECKELLALTVSKLSELSASLCAWEPIAECPRHVFGRQAIPITWDFAEGVVTSDSSGSFSVALDNIARGMAALFDCLSGSASPQVADAQASLVPHGSAGIWFTDPPYYFAVPYSDLSDFFFVWLKRTLPNHPLMRDPFDDTNPLTPKTLELCEMAFWDSTRYPHKDARFFEDGMTRVFAEGRRVLREDGIGAVVFAHKTTEGWEALLSGMINGGWVITGSWPIATEMGSRLRARDSAALATSVHLICRPRSDNAEVGDWADVLRELPNRVGNWMERLQG